MIPIRDFYIYIYRRGKLYDNSKFKELNVCQVLIQKTEYVLTHFLPFVPILQVRKHTHWGPAACPWLPASGRAGSWQLSCPCLPTAFSYERIPGFPLNCLFRASWVASKGQFIRKQVFSGAVGICGKWKGSLDSRMLYRPLLAFYSSDIVYQVTEWNTCLLSFIDSVAWAKLTGQVAQPSVLTTISKIIPGTTRGKVQSSEFKVPEEPLNTCKAGVLLPMKDHFLQSNIGN